VHTASWRHILADASYGKTHRWVRLVLLAPRALCEGGFGVAHASLDARGGGRVGGIPASGHMSEVKL
jgi:transcription-repair coupling factor (superfamily II helicase)